MKHPTDSEDKKKRSVFFRAAILILAILTAAALAALAWFQRRAHLIPTGDQEKIYSSMYNDLTPATKDLLQYRQCCF